MASISDALLTDLYRRAAADRWKLSREAFAAALARSAAKRFAGAATSPREQEHYLRSLRLEELALASACAEGHEAAWEHFILQYRPVLYRAADALDPRGEAREIADSLYADLFGLKDQEGGRQSLFRYFHGRSSLATWLRAVLAQRLVDRARVDVRHAPLPDEEPAGPDPGAPDPDRGRYLWRMHSALRQALSRLAPRDRLRLRYYYAQGLKLAQIGRLFHEHEASVSRHLAATRTMVRRDVEEQLRRDGLDAEQIRRSFEIAAEDPGTLDLAQLITEPSGARDLDSIVQEDEGVSAKRGMK
jgi:RNA polymerase sigma factor (sigma-70 family)